MADDSDSESEGEDTDLSFDDEIVFLPWRKSMPVASADGNLEGINFADAEHGHEPAAVPINSAAADEAKDKPQFEVRSQANLVP